MIITTGESYKDCIVNEVKGLVSASVFYAAGGVFGEGTFSNKATTLFQNQIATCEGKLAEQAEKLGANAVINVKMDIAIAGETQVALLGTAVVLVSKEKIKRDEEERIKRELEKKEEERKRIEAKNKALEEIYKRAGDGECSLSIEEIKTCLENEYELTHDMKNTVLKALSFLSAPISGRDLADLLPSRFDTMATLQVLSVLVDNDLVVKDSDNKYSLA